MKDSAKWLRLSPTDFEELVFWILQREGFFNVRWYGESGSDKGRDVTCQRTELLGPRVLVHDCVVQCKKYSGRVARQRIYQDIGTIQTLEEVHRMSVRRVISALEQRFFETHEVISVLRKQQMRVELTLRTDPIESLQMPTGEEWRKMSGREKTAPRAHLPIVRCFLEGHLERCPSDVELCAWIRFCYNRDFYAEVVALCLLNKPG